MSIVTNPINIIVKPDSKTLIVKPDNKNIVIAKSGAKGDKGDKGDPGDSASIADFKLQALSNYTEYPNRFEELVFDNSEILISKIFWNKPSGTGKIKLLTITFNYTGDEISSITYKNERTLETLTKTKTVVSPLLSTTNTVLS